MAAVAHRPVPQSLLDELEAGAIPYELLPHVRTTSAEEEAHALGLSPREVAKTVVLAVGDRFVRAVVLASERVDLGKVRAFLDEGDVAIATEQEIADAYPEFELGAVPPLAGRHDRVLVDVRVLENVFAIVEAGTHDHSLRLPTRDLVSHESALLCDIC
jgi:Ala-tRNA(Pro) deacylase